MGGYHNAHLHLDRANTLEPGHVDHGRVDVLGCSFMSLQKKHALIPTVHEGPAYDRGDLLRRDGEACEVMMDVNTRLADTMVDVIPDGVGTDAFDTIMEYTRGVAGQITIRAASHTPLGFQDKEPERWEIFEQGVAKADFIGSLADADDRIDYPDNIGFDEHCVRILELGRITGKMLHVHTDQFNHPGENGTERLIEVMLKTGRHDAPDGAPLVGPLMQTRVH